MAKILRNIDQIIDTQGNELSVANPVEMPAPVLSFRNKIINGNFAIWQRGTTSISPHSGYQTADRWYLGANIGNSRNDDSPAEFQYSLDISGSVADSNGYALLFHRIESKNIISSIGKKLTLSAYVRNIGTSTANVSAEIYYPNSTDNWAAQSVVGGLTTQAITNEWSRIVFPSFDVPADANKGLEVRIFRHDANNDQQWRITGVQLEEGEVATPFEQRPYGVEEQLCKRYWCWGKFKVGGRATTGSGNRDNIFFSTTMRVHPTVALFNETKNGIGTTYPEIGGPNHFTVYWLGSVSSDHTTYYSEYSADSEL